MDNLLLTTSSMAPSREHELHFLKTETVFRISSEMNRLPGYLPKDALRMYSTHKSETLPSMICYPQVTQIWRGFSR